MSIEPNVPNTSTERPNRTDPRFDFSNVENRGQSLGEFSVHRYPQNLAVETDGVTEYPHYMMFFINVRDDDVSKMDRGDIASVVFDNSSNNRVSSEVGEKLFDSTELLGYGYLGGSVGGFAGKAAAFSSPLLRSIGMRAPGIANPEAWLSGVGTLAGGAAALSVGGVKKLTKKGSVGRSTVTMKNAIALYLPTPPVSLYSAGWLSTDLGMIGGMGNVAGDLLDSNSGNLKDRAVNAVGKVGLSAGTAALLRGADRLRDRVIGDVGGLLSTAAAVAPNPFKAQLFTSMGFRRFRFDYTFLPKSQAEYDEVAKIIYLFKKYMHPVILDESSKFLLRYPAEFTIGHFYKGMENNNLFKMSNCALTNMAVKYGGDDFVSVRGTQGIPSEIVVSLDFVELELLTRDRIEQGY